MLHEGHRERLRNKAKEYGFSCLEEHERLELLLGYSIPRRNTNEIAHELIDSAGSLRGVFDLDTAEIEKVHGMGKYSVFMLKLIGFIMNRPKEPPKKRVDMSRFSAVKEYAEMLFGASEVEELYALFLDKKFSLISCKKISSGSAWQAGIDKKSIFLPAITEMASGVVLLHNHPGGVAQPSRDDISFTVEMERACGVLGVDLLEHMVYADGECHPIMMKAKLNSTFAIEYDHMEV